LQPDEHYLWVAYREPSPSQLTSGVAAVDTRTLEPVAHIPTGRGVHDMVIGGQDRYLFVSNREDATVSVIDIGKLEKIRDITTAQEPFGLAYSEVGGAVYVSHRAGGVVTAIDEDSLEVTARLEAEPGLEMIRFAPDGDRLGYVVNPAKNLLHIIDPATQRIIQTGVMEDGPDQVAFSDELVYVRHRGTGTVLMIPRDEVGEEGAPVPVVDFPGGQHPPGQMKLPTPAESIVQAPGATAVLVANPGDQAIYYYKEGMAAPMGNFQNYERQPRAIRVIDRSLQEIRPGVYQTAVKLRRPGRYDLAFFLDSPRLIHCFSLNVGKNPAIELERMGKTRAFEVRYETAKTHFEVGEEVSLRFEVRDALSGDPKNGVDDIQVLAFLAPGIWQKHLTALALDDGGYEVRFQLPREGVYYVFVQSRSLGFAYQSSPYITLMAGELAVQPPGTARAAELGGEQDGKKDGKKKD
jgi:YVTN family beta-propeller protein